MHLKTLVHGKTGLRQEILRGDEERLLRYFLEEPIATRGVLMFEESDDDWLQVEFRDGKPHRVVLRRDERSSHWAEGVDVSREQLVPAIRGYCAGNDAILRELLPFRERASSRKFSKEEIDRCFDFSARPWWKFW